MSSKYENPKIDFVEFCLEDVISTSGESCIVDCTIDSSCPSHGECTHNA